MTTQTQQIALTADQIAAVESAVQYHTNDKPHYAHMQEWLPGYAYDRTYRNRRTDKIVSERTARDKNGDVREGYCEDKQINDIGRAMLAEHERQLKAIDSPGYHKIVMERSL